MFVSSLAPLVRSVPRLKYHASSGRWNCPPVAPPRRSGKKKSVDPTERAERCWWYMGVSKNRGKHPQKWMFYNGWFGGTTIFRNTHMVETISNAYNEGRIYILGALAIHRSNWAMYFAALEAASSSERRSRVVQAKMVFFSETVDSRVFNSRRTTNRRNGGERGN